MAYEMVMPYHLHMPSYFLETFTEYPILQIQLSNYPTIDETILSNASVNLSAFFPPACAK